MAGDTIPSGSLAGLRGEPLGALAPSPKPPAGPAAGRGTTTESPVVYAFAERVGLHLFRGWESQQVLAGVFADSAASALAPVVQAVAGARVGNALAGAESMLEQLQPLVDILPAIPSPGAARSVPGASAAAAAPPAAKTARREWPAEVQRLLAAMREDADRAEREFVDDEDETPTAAVPPVGGSKSPSGPAIPTLSSRGKRFKAMLFGLLNIARAMADAAGREYVEQEMAATSARELLALSLQTAALTVQSSGLRKSDRTIGEHVHRVLQERYLGHARSLPWPARYTVITERSADADAGFPRLHVYSNIVPLPVQPTPLEDAADADVNLRVLHSAMQSLSWNQKKGSLRKSTLRGDLFDFETGTGISDLQLWEIKPLTDMATAVYQEAVYRVGFNLVKMGLMSWGVPVDPRPLIAGGYWNLRATLPTTGGASVAGAQSTPPSGGFDPARAAAVTALGQVATPVLSHTPIILPGAGSFVAVPIQIRMFPGTVSYVVLDKSHLEALVASIIAAFLARLNEGRKKAGKTLADLEEELAWARDNAAGSLTPAVETVMVWFMMVAAALAGGAQRLMLAPSLLIIQEQEPDSASPSAPFSSASPPGGMDEVTTTSVRLAGVLEIDGVRVDELPAMVEDVLTRMRRFLDPPGPSGIA